MSQPDRTSGESPLIHYHHEAADPLCLWEINLSTYPNKHAGCHWHEEMEFICIESGRMNFFVGGEKMLLGQGDCLFINAGQLHYGYSVQGQPCKYLCLLLRPGIFSQDAAAERAYLASLGQDESFPFFLTLAETPLGDRMAGTLRQIQSVLERKEPGYQLDMWGLLLPLFAILVREQRKRPSYCLPDGGLLAAQKRMLAYIAGHFSENISVEQIALSAALDKKKCNALFQKYLGQTAQKYLIAYRLEASGNLLARTDKSISEICALCGFHHASYYGKMFELAYGCTPTDYRKKRKG